MTAYIEAPARTQPCPYLCIHRDELRLRQAIPGKRGLCTQPAEGFVRDIVEAGVEEGVLSPRFFPACVKIGNDPTEEGCQIDTVSVLL